jgi:hypothetical protein
MYQILNTEFEEDICVDSGQCPDSKAYSLLSGTDAILLASVSLLFELTINCLPNPLRRPTLIPCPSPRGRRE